VGAGEQVLLMGRSGSGKSTLLQIIAGLMRPDRGTVQIAGQNLGVLGEPQRDRFRALNLGYIYQTFHLLPGFSALENVLLAMSFSGQSSDASRARLLLERVGLGKRTKHKPSMLSVGEQQRVAVARALANRPKLLLADEPTASVDARHQQQILDLIRDTCREEDVALLMVTHADEIAKQFDRVEHLEQINQVVGV
jgi:putative ABC transport system ATP-binding protein